MTPIVDRVYLKSDGIEMFLGPLEAAIMRAVWDEHHTTREIMRYLWAEYNSEIALTTTATTANRLVAKQLLARVRAPGDRGHYRYVARIVDEDEFITICATDTINRLITEHGKAVYGFLAKLIDERPR